MDSVPKKLTSWLSTALLTYYHQAKRSVGSESKSWAKILYYAKSDFLAGSDKYLMDNYNVVEMLFMVFTVTKSEMGGGRGTKLCTATSPRRSWISCYVATWAASLHSPIGAINTLYNA